MTVAICIRCGTWKIGAFTICGSCGFEPDQMMVCPPEEAQLRFSE